MLILRIPFFIIFRSTINIQKRDLARLFFTFVISFSCVRGNKINLARGRREGENKSTNRARKSEMNERGS